MRRIIEPTLLLNEHICKANIKKMAMRIKSWKGEFRPHFKTHQSAEVGEWFRETGVECIAVSSMKMAKYFAAHGWKDITLAISVTKIHAPLIDELAAEINLSIVVEDIETMVALEQSLNNPVGLYVKVDTGYHRTGVDADGLVEIKHMLGSLKTAKRLIFIGFLTHAGNTYRARGKVQLGEIVKPALEKTLALKTFLKDDFPLMQLSWGDTPSCSVYHDFFGIDEYRPGNFVFYDYAQVQIGSCEMKDVAVCLAAPVIAVHPERNELVVHGGAVHLSKDRIALEDGTTSYGKAVQLNGLDWNVSEEIGEVKSLSQEHGIVSVSDKTMNNIKPGDLIGVIPVHSCLTANLMKQFLNTKGNFIEMMK